jgi:hypothetical protein
MRRAVDWIADHVIEEVNFSGAAFLAIGDPKAVASISQPRIEDLDDFGYRWLEFSAGRVLLVRGQSHDFDGPWAWVIASEDGPVQSIELSPTLEVPQNGNASELAGWLETPSGRLVIAAAHAISDVSLDIDTSEGRGSDSFLRNGFILVVRMEYPGRCEVRVFPGSKSQRVASITLRLPIPSWTKESRPNLRDPK